MYRHRTRFGSRKTKKSGSAGDVKGKGQGVSEAEGLKTADSRKCAVMTEVLAPAALSQAQYDKLKRRALLAPTGGANQPGGINNLAGASELHPGVGGMNTVSSHFPRPETHKIDQGTRSRDQQQEWQTAPRDNSAPQEECLCGLTHCSNSNRSRSIYPPRMLTR